MTDKIFKNAIKEISNDIGSIPIMADGYVTDDNVAIALASYFRNLPECPDDSMNDEIGWNQWAIDKTEDVLDRIAEYFLTSLKRKGKTEAAIEMRRKIPV